MIAPTRLPHRMLQLTRPVLQWLQEDDSWQRLPLRTRATMAWSSAWASLNQRISYALADKGDQLSNTLSPQAPVLILGPWRSGSTAMHELLAAASGMPTPQTWQCMNASAFSLSRAPDANLHVARPMDGMTITSRSPQEDEFALLTLGVASSYRAFLMPHRIMELTCTLEPSYWLSHSEWITTWLGFLRAVEQRSTQNSRLPLLLKSPNHTFRLQAILNALPGSKIVWMVRAPEDVFLSNRKMWSTMSKQYGLTEQQGTDTLDRFLALALERTADALAWALDNVPSGQIAIVDQAELAAAPIPTTMSIFDTLLSSTEQSADQARLHATASRLTASGQDSTETAPSNSLPLPGAVTAACRHLARVQARALARRQSA